MLLDARLVLRKPFVHRFRGFLLFGREHRVRFLERRVHRLRFRRRLRFWRLILLDDSR